MRNKDNFTDKRKNMEKGKNIKNKGDVWEKWKLKF